MGGWNFAPWRGAFYPPGLKHSGELAYASRRVTAIEINGTFYRAQSAASFAKWREETPEGFVFALKGHRAVVSKARLAEGGEAVDRFVRSGIAELGEKLGPILWQLAPVKTFNPDDIDAFLSLLPRAADGVALKHALEVRHPSFMDAQFATLAAKHKVAIVYGDSDDYPAMADVTGDFVYARLQRGSDDEPHCYKGGRPGPLGGARQALVKRRGAGGSAPPARQARRGSSPRRVPVFHP